MEPSGEMQPNFFLIQSLICLELIIASFVVNLSGFLWIFHPFLNFFYMS